MAWKFKLQSVLNYRQSLEDQAQQVLTASLLEQRQLEEQQQQYQHDLDNNDKELKKRQQIGMTVAEMDVYEGRIYHCRSFIKRISAQLLQLAEQIESERQALLIVARERQVMEKLKEKQEAEFHQELARKERIMLDEISLRSKGNKL